MKARLKDLTISRDGQRIVSFATSENVEKLYDELNAVDVEIMIKKHRQKRSLDANAYAWVLIDRIAEKVNAGKTDVYRAAIRDIGGVSDTICLRSEGVEAFKYEWQKKGLGCQVEEIPSKIDGCTNLIVYYGSSSYDTAQMSALIDNLISECKELGIPTETPEEIEKIKSLWANAPKGR